MSDQQSPENAHAQKQEPRDREERRPQGWRSGPLAGLALSLVGGVLAWLVIQAFHPVFTNEEAAGDFGVLPPEIEWQLSRDNTMFILAMLSASTATGLVLAEGMRRRWRNVAFAAAATLVTAVVVGGLAGYLGVIGHRSFKQDPGLSDLERAIRVNIIMLGGIGAAVGIGTGIFFGRRVLPAIECSIAGLLAGVLAGLLYPMVVAVAMPGAITKVLIPIGAGERLLWCGLASGLVGLTIPLVAKKRPKSRE